MNNEPKEIITTVKSNSNSNSNSIPKLVVLIAGQEGIGKTHLACTLSIYTPAYLIDTEFRATIVTSKFKNVKSVTAKDYSELNKAVDMILSTQEDGTIVLDSGSDLQYYSELEYLSKTHKDRVGMPYNWAEVYKYANSIINKIKFSKRFHLVITVRMKDEYIDDKCTGRKIPRIYNALPYKADIMLTFNSSNPHELIVNKNGFDNRKMDPISAHLTLPKMLNQLSDGLYF